MIHRALPCAVYLAPLGLDEWVFVINWDLPVLFISALWGWENGKVVVCDEPMGG